MVEVLIKILVGLLTTIMSYLIYEIRKMKEKINRSPDRDEMEKHVDLKLEVHKVTQKDIKEDIAEIKTKLDKLIDMHLNRPS